MIKIGTSGYSYFHWRGVFYPENLPPSKWLEYYSHYFDTVELNVTFYRLPQKKIFESWYKQTPHDFIFVIKGSRFITHIKKLKDCQDSLNLLFDRILALKEKLGIILWQLPPNFKANPKVLEEFLKTLAQKWVMFSKNKLRCSFEFRNQSWYTAEICDLLKKYNYALCIADSPNFPKVEKVTADYLYIRLHGGTELYSSNYSDKELELWTSKIKKWQKQNLDIYIYFNNDAFGYAIENAKKLKNFLINN